MMRYDGRGGACLLLAMAGACAVGVGGYVTEAHRATGPWIIFPDVALVTEFSGEMELYFHVAGLSVGAAYQVKVVELDMRHGIHAGLRLQEADTTVSILDEASCHAATHANEVPS